LRIALFSDVHLEIADWHYESIVEADVVILAGDISKGLEGIAWAREAIAERFPNKTLIYVAGNHEYYDSNLDLLYQFQGIQRDCPNFHFLENRVFTRGSVRFLGATLWSDFSFYGVETIDSCMAAAGRYLMDFRKIETSEGLLLLPSDLPALHQKAVQWLDDELSKPFDGKTVVITHFAPHRKCIASQYQGDLLTPYFVNDLSWMMEKHHIDVWCFGHTHHNVDFIAESGCRVVSNQVGYPMERFKNGHNFRADLVIEV
jgi:predicted phosphodiesterase